MIGNVRSEGTIVVRASVRSDGLAFGVPYKLKYHRKPAHRTFAEALRELVLVELVNDGVGACR